MSEAVESQLKAVFDKLLTENFGDKVPPEPQITPTGIVHLDAILGGGFGSSLPIMISSAPETGKSSTAVFFAKQFIESHPNSYVVYIDVETASAGTKDNKSGIKSRLTHMGIPENRFQYQPMLTDVKGIYNVIKDLADMKKKLENACSEAGKPEEVNMLVILDSLSSCPCSKALTAEDPKEYIGLKAREQSHTLDKIKPVLAFSKMNLILIDQVRANMKMDGPFAKQDVKGVGEWNNIKSSASSSVLQHNLKQWLFISKKKELYPGSDINVNGWILNVKTEKNKLCSSGYSVSLVFDKHETLHKLYSEYLFMKEMTDTEHKITGRNEKKLPYPLLIQGKTHKHIDIVDPKTGEKVGKSSSFYEKDLVEKYNGDPEFKQIFDHAIRVSTEERINKFLLRNEVNIDEIADDNE